MVSLAIFLNFYVPKAFKNCIFWILSKATELRNICRKSIETSSKGA